MAWDPSPDINVVGYYLHFGIESGNYTTHQDVSSRISTAVAGLTKGTTYYFAVTAYTADGLESDPSNEIFFIVPGILRVEAALPGDPVQINFPVEPGHRYILQSSADLESWTNLWEKLGVANEWVGFTDANAIALPKQFYRLELRK
ncbi:MAG: fibronectin type III domain-containing protein [Verrucomicrobiota bacterium]